MTDLDIVKRCADRMDYKVALDIHGTYFFVTDGTKQPERKDYDPLTDDAQAMALVRKFELTIFKSMTLYWIVSHLGTTANNKDLNRAICECVARLP